MWSVPHLFYCVTIKSSSSGGFIRLTYSIYCAIRQGMTNDKPPQYRDKRLQQFADGYRVRDFQSFEQQLKKGLAVLEDAQSRDDLRLLPSNCFEGLAGDRKGQFSIRINKQWRLCFEWSESENRPFNIEVVEYH